MLHVKRGMHLFAVLLSVPIIANLETKFPYSGNINLYRNRMVAAKEAEELTREEGFPGLFAGITLSEDYSHYGINTQVAIESQQEAQVEALSLIPEQPTEILVAELPMEEQAELLRESEFDVEQAFVEVTTPLNPYFQLSLSSEDYLALERIVQAEAGGEDEQGKILVAQVVLNRILDANFGDTATNVIFERIGGSAQFTPTVDGRFFTETVTEETRQAVVLALNGADISQGALYFSARSMAEPSAMAWFDRNLRWLFQHGGHEFFTIP